MSVRRGILRSIVIGALGIGAGLVGGALVAGASPVKGWTRGKGWGWIWGSNDERGALNALGPEAVKRALAVVKQGRIYDLGVSYDRSSYKFQGHSPAEVMSFRSPAGLDRQKDQPQTLPGVNPAHLAWHSNALFINDNVGTQLDGLGHITTGADAHWYNGYKEAEWGGDFGLRKADASKIPPIVARGVLIDVAGYRRVDALPGHTAIGPDEIDKVLAWEKVDLEPGDVALIRTGTLRYWGEAGADHDALDAHDTAGITLQTAKHLVEDKGAILLAADTTGLEVHPPQPGSTSFAPIHEYLLVQQGVHVGELHDAEALARDKVYEFCYVALTNKIKGTAAGFAMRPIAIR